MKFIEVLEGVSIRIDSIVSIKTLEDSVVLIETDIREYKIVADYKLLMAALEDEEIKKRESGKFLNQFFGG